jgi:hypothetical protein
VRGAARERARYEAELQELNAYRARIGPLQRQRLATCYIYMMLTYNCSLNVGTGVYLFSAPEDVPKVLWNTFSSFPSPDVLDFFVLSLRILVFYLIPLNS